jgi:hypothetical protein
MDSPVAITKTAAKTISPPVVAAIVVASTLVIGGIVVGVLYATKIIPNGLPRGFENVPTKEGVELYKFYVDQLLKNGGISKAQHQQMLDSLTDTKVRWLVLAMDDPVMSVEAFSNSTAEKAIAFLEKATSGVWFKGTVVDYKPDLSPTH